MLTWTGPDALRTTLVPLDDLRAHPRNPRIGDVEAIAASLRRFGQQRPVLALPDGTLVAGHHVWKGARELGWTHVSVVHSDLSDSEVDAYLLADNRLGQLGTFDSDVLAQLLQDVEAGSAAALEGVGYQRADIDALLAEIALRDRVPKTDPDDVPPVPAEPRSEVGVVYELGPHRLMCGDSTDLEHLRALVEERPVDVIITDPPYGVDYQGGAQAFSALQGKRKVRRIDGDKNAEIYETVLPLIQPLLRDDGAIYLWYSDSRAREVMGSLADAGFRQRAVIVWVKDVPTGSLIAHYIPRHEPMIYASKGSGKVRWYGPTNEGTIWEHPKPRVNELHPTQKPVALFERALRNSSNAGDRILDPFGGSGTALMAAEALGRRALLMEIDPGYCDVIRRRYAEHVGRPDLLP